MAALASTRRDMCQTPQQTAEMNPSHYLTLTCIDVSVNVQCGKEYELRLIFLISLNKRDILILCLGTVPYLQKVKCPKMT